MKPCIIGKPCPQRPFSNAINCPDCELDKVLLYQGSAGTKWHRDAKCASGPYGGRVWTHVFTLKEARELAKHYVRPCKRCASDLYEEVAL